MFPLLLTRQRKLLFRFKENLMSSNDKKLNSKSQTDETEMTQAEMEATVDAVMKKYDRESNTRI